MFTGIAAAVAALGVLTGVGMKIRANQKAKKAGQPKPYKPGELAEEVLTAGEKAAKSLTK